jgi:integrase
MIPARAAAAASAKTREEMTEDAARRAVPHLPGIHELKTAIAARLGMSEDNLQRYDELMDASDAVVDLVRSAKLDAAEVAARDLLARFPDQPDGWDRTPTLSPATHSAMPSMLPCCTERTDPFCCTSDLNRRKKTSACRGRNVCPARLPTPRPAGCLTNPIHRTCFAVKYACGLRIGEAATLEIGTIDSHNGLLRIIGKGNKERLVPLPEPIIPEDV